MFGIEFWGPMIGIGLVLVVASIGLWRAGQLRDLFNKVPEIDKYVERLADAYDNLKAKYEELEKKLNLKP